MVGVVKSLGSLLQRYIINVGFLLGFFLVLLTYFTVSEQFALRGPNVFVKAPAAAAHSSPASTPAKSEMIKEPPMEETVAPPVLSDQPEQEPADQEPPAAPESSSPLKDQNAEQQATTDQQSVPAPVENKIMCKLDDFLSDTCDITGDVRTHGASLTVLVVPPPAAPPAAPQEWQVRPYSRKHMESIKKATVKSLASPAQAPPCSVKLPVPALVFATGGLIGNYWHDFTDVLVPLFAASRRFDGEVQFLVGNIQRWWLSKYSDIFKKLSNYEIVDADKDNLVRCYPEVLVGTPMHKEFSIDPARAAGGVGMPDFTAFLREAYSLPRAAPARLRSSSGEIKPRLMYIQRFHYRRVLNVPAVVEVAEQLGFEVVLADPKGGVAEFAKLVNSVDVLVGMHGAGLTNAVFLPAGAVLVQIVPYGKMEGLARTDFGAPAADMGLKYVEYSVSAEESTLVEMYGKDSEVVRDPEAVHRQGWDKVAEYYLGKQDVRVDAARFAPYLQQALEHLRS